MTNDQLEWLPLSVPPQPKETQSEFFCPHCNKAAPVNADTCPHCGRPLILAAGLTEEALPEIALLERQLDIAPPPEDWFSGRGLDTPAMYDLRLQAERLYVTGGFERLICLDDINIDHYQYQLEAAQRALRDMGGRALLADEVGLGKTIEAGIVMKELIERGLAQTVLIIVPASLTWQWQEEMAAKFYEDFLVLEKLSQLSAPNPLPPKACRWIISYSRARASAWAERLLAFEYDLLIVDEAHKLKNHRSKSYRFVDQIRKRYVLMLSATPVHNNLLELYNLITILRPGHLGTRRAFARDFIATPTALVKRRAYRRTIYSRPSVHAYLRKNRQARQEYRQKGDEAFRIVARTESLDEFLAVFLPKADAQPKAAIEEIRSLMPEGYDVVEFEGVEWRSWYRRRIDFVCRLRLRPKAKRPEPSRPDPRRRLRPQNPALVRALLREVMIRNRRSSVGVRFPPREAAIYHLTLSPPERKLYNDVTAYIREELRNVQQLPSGKRPAGGVLQLRLMTLQKQLASSPQAAVQGLEKLTAGQNDDRLNDYLALARSIEQGRKVKAVQTILEQYPHKTLIFTDYLASMRALNATLTASGFETTLFHGGLSAYERIEAVREFRNSAQVMISLRSGGEGHNLQFCRQMINFDLPWNPMIIEQRIGRIHRLGQKRKVRIFNLSVANTIEAYILELLANKIRMFELVIGELDLILGELAGQRSFESYLQEAWVGSQSEAELLQKIVELEKIITGARATYTQIRSTSDELSDILGGAES